MMVEPQDSTPPADPPTDSPPDSRPDSRPAGGKPSKPPHQGRRLIGYAVVIVLLLGSAFVVDAALSGGGGSGSSEDAVPWRSDFDAALSDAGSGDRSRLVLAEFSADWCPPCQEMERTVYSRQDVAKAMTDGFIPVQVDVTHANADETRILQRYGLRGIPVLLALKPDGQEVARVIGPIGHQRLKGWLAQLRSTHTAGNLMGQPPTSGPAASASASAGGGDHPSTANPAAS